jgi:transposase InsO family protein
VKYCFIKENSKQFSIELMCKIFAVSRSGYYSWCTSKLSNRDLANQNLDIKIKSIFDEHKSRYGAPRIARVLQTNNELCSKNRVARRMKNMNLKAIAKKKFKVTTDSEHNKPIFSNVLKRDFTTTDINQKWVQDITYLRTKEGWLYLAVVIDIDSRAVIGWSMSNRISKQVVYDALLMALFRRKFPTGVIIHSDRGSQYCSDRYRKLINNNNLIGSMSRKGNCWDNAVAESFFHTLKVELVNEVTYQSREIARRSVFEYIEAYYNRKRMHSAIDYRVPIDVELRV